MSNDALLVVCINAVKCTNSGECEHGKPHYAQRLRGVIKHGSYSSQSHCTDSGFCLTAGARVRCSEITTDALAHEMR